ncbi:hypothetical protein PRVXH_002525 [Proteinivorax hydrogeniformans]|uniref:Uncharacterized protein n=1 Tax=Proteinivorax hydrogeniformans TaxID=1826727 RepID=A0AAU8HTA5_9FIRM
MNQLILEFVILAAGFFVGLFVILLASQFKGAFWKIAKHIGGVIFIVTGGYFIVSGANEELYSYISFALIFVGLFVILINLLTKGHRFDKQQNNKKVVIK